MLKSKDIRYAMKRKRVWDSFGWGYRSLAQLSKKHSIKCNCSMCKSITMMKRQENKKTRLRLKLELKTSLDD